MGKTKQQCAFEVEDLDTEELAIYMQKAIIFKRGFSSAASVVAKNARKSILG